MQATLTAPATETTLTVGATDCPDCETALVNGQGLFHCADCGWTGPAE